MVRTIELKMNYWDLYPRREPIVLREVRRVRDGIGVEILLEAGIDGFSHYLYAFDDEAFTESLDGRIRICFTGREKSRSKTLRVKAVLMDGSETQEYRMTVSYYPSEMYAKSGLTFPSWLIILESDLHLSRSRVEDYIINKVTDEDRTYALRRWGRLIADKPDYEAAREIAKAIIADLEEHRGIPSDEMKGLRPFQQYERALSGRDHVWCGNIAAIFSQACNSLGIPCRRIAMQRPLTDEEEKEAYRILLAEGHTTTEIFSERLNRWIWIDPTFRILGAYLNDSDPLDLFELYLCINRPEKAARLRLLEYDASIGEERLVPFDECRYRASLRNYLKMEQRFRFFAAD